MKKVVAQFGKTAVNALTLEPSNGETVSILIFGDISEWWGVNSADVFLSLRGRTPSQVNVYISSQGGSVVEAFVIHDLLKGSAANVTCYLTGICASAATIVACAGNQVVMSEQCIYMIHKPMFQWAGGNADELRKDADVLDLYQTMIEGVYKRRTKMSESELTALMNEESWFTAAEAERLGFVDEVVQAITIDTEGQLTGDLLWQSWWKGAWDEGAIKNKAIFNCLERGLGSIKSPQVQQIINANTMKKGLFQTVVNALVKAGIVTTENADKAVETLQNEAVDVLSISPEDLGSAVENALKGRTVSLTPENLLTIIDGATPEVKAKIFSALSPAPAEGEPTLQVLKNGLDALTKTVSGMQKGGVINPTNSNGDKPLPEKEDDQPQTALTPAQQRFADNAWKNNKIGAQDYKLLTGQEPPARAAQ